LKIIAFLLSMMFAWLDGVRAQQPTMPVIGFLSSQSGQVEDLRVSPFKQGLKEGGFVEGQNVAIEYRWAENQYDRLPALAADLVRHHVNLLVSAGGTPGALAAKADCSRRSWPQLIRERTGEGRKRAMAAGIKFGRKRKLSDYQRAEAIKRRAAGETLASIAKSYGVHVTMISRL
jgi:hypothetical protein